MSLEKEALRASHGKQESEPPTVFCLGISLWDKPCVIPATKYCERVTAGSARHTSGSELAFLRRGKEVPNKNCLQHEVRVSVVFRPNLAIVWHFKHAGVLTCKGIVVNEPSIVAITR